MDEIPFTSGPLKDWPLFEEMLDDVFDRAERIAGGKADDVLREQVAEGLKGFYEIVRKHEELFAFAVSIPMPAGSTSDDRRKVEVAATALIASAKEKVKAMATDLLGERMILELKLAKKRLGYEE